MATETGWLIEKNEPGETILYLGQAPKPGLLAWTPDSLQAVRFARKVDAQWMVPLVVGATDVVEHQWG